MPNWTFLALHFLHTMALALWVGGIVAIGIIVAPIAFKEAPDRSLAGRIVGGSLQRFDSVVLVCITALILSSVLMVRWYGRWSPWYAIEYVCITLMSLSAIYSVFVLSPRIRALRDEAAGTEAGEQQTEFDRLHQAALLSMQFNLACGTVAILFS